MAANQESDHPNENGGEAACENQSSKQDSTSSSTDEEGEVEELELTGADTTNPLADRLSSSEKNWKDDTVSMETIRVLATQALALSVDDWSSLPTIHYYHSNNVREEEEEEEEDALFESVVSILWVRIIVAIMDRDEKPVETDNEGSIPTMTTTADICRRALFIPQDSSLSERNNNNNNNNAHQTQPWRISCSNQMLQELRKLIQFILTTSSSYCTKIETAMHDDFCFHTMQRAVAVMVHANKLLDRMNANAEVDPILALALLFAALVGYRTCHNPMGAFMANQSDEHVVLMPDEQNDAAVALFFGEVSKPEYQHLFTNLFQDDEDKYRHFRNIIISGVVTSNTDNTANAIHLDYSMLQMSWNDSRWFDEDIMKTNTAPSRFMMFGNSSYRQPKTSRPLTHRVPRRGSNQSDEFSDATPTQQYTGDDFVIVDGTGRRSSLSMVRNSFGGNEPTPPSRGMEGRHLSLEMDHQLPQSGGWRLSVESGRNRRMSGDSDHHLGHSTSRRRGSMFSEVSDITTDLALLQQSSRRLSGGIQTPDRRGSLFSEASDVTDDLQSELSLSPKRRVGGRRRASLDFVPRATRRLSNDSLTEAVDRNGATNRPKRLSLDNSAPSSRRYSNDIKNLYDLSAPYDNLGNVTEFCGHRSRKLWNPYGFDSFDDDDGEESIADSVAFLRTGASGIGIDLISELAKEFDPILVQQLLATEEPKTTPASRGVGRSKSSDSASIPPGVRRTKSNDSFVDNMTKGSFGVESIDMTRKRMQGGKLSRDHKRFEGKYPVDLSLGDDDDEDDDEEESTSLSVTSEDNNKHTQAYHKTIGHHHHNHGKNSFPGLTDSPSSPESPEQLMRARRRDTGLSGLRFSPASLGLRIDEEMPDLSRDQNSFSHIKTSNLLRRTSIRRPAHAAEDAIEGQDSLHLGFISAGEVGGKLEPDDSSKANLVDLLLRASQIGEYLQGWENMIFWVQRQYFELGVAQRREKGPKPLDDFYEETIGFLNGYVKPLAWQLDSSGLFGDMNGEIFAKNVDANKELWITHGVELIDKWEQEIISKCKKRVVEL
jgi:hypothetical protein